MKLVAFRQVNKLNFRSETIKYEVYRFVIQFRLQLIKCNLLETKYTNTKFQHTSKFMRILDKRNALCLKILCLFMNECTTSILFIIQNLPIIECNTIFSVIIFQKTTFYTLIYLYTFINTPMYQCVLKRRHIQVLTSVYN